MTAIQPKLFSHFDWVPFIQNSNRSLLTDAASFPSIFSQLLQYSRQRPSFSAHRAALMTKTDLTFPAFSIRFADVAFQFCFPCKFSISFHESERSVTDDEVCVRCGWRFSNEFDHSPANALATVFKTNSTYTLQCTISY